MLDRAREAGVRGVMAVGAGYGLSLNAAAVALAEEHADVWATAGVHPRTTPTSGTTWHERAVDGWLAHERVLAVGECGLDYWYENSPREAPACTALRAQLRTGVHATSCRS